MLPTLFSMAELSTAMPRAGGSYYFMDRSLGPLLGAVGGLGTWLALVFKSAFALIGMGAYLVIFIDLPMKPVALGLTVAFTLLNIFGVKETTVVQRVLVTALIAILTAFIIAGLMQVNASGWGEVHENQFRPLLPYGLDGAVYTAGLVFVSYAGLTKVASVAEEVKDPEKNIPRGMLLSLGAATFLYVVGVYILTALLPADELRSDLTPIATAAPEVLGWLPAEAGLVIIVVAAIAAFASTANAGIMSASRYPLAMARDKLLQSVFGKIGRFDTPHIAILSSGALMVAVILTFSEMGMAKLASAFQLLIFVILNLAVIIMRESNIPSYLPGYKSPLYPWLQFLGIIFSIFLITKMGWMSILFSLGIILFSVIWFYAYARHHVMREGAIYHIFERLGRERHMPLEDEFRTILKEKGPIDPKAYENMIARAHVVIMEEPETFEEVMKAAAEKLEADLPLNREEIGELTRKKKHLENTPVFKELALPHFSHPDIERPAIVLMRFKKKVIFERPGQKHRALPLQGLILLAGSKDKNSTHLRFLSQLTELIDEEGFTEHWGEAETEADLRECLMADETHFALMLTEDASASDLIGKKAAEWRTESGARILFLFRNNRILLPEEDTELRKSDRLTIVGAPKEIDALREKFRPAESD